ncbi:hypothetical protein EXIGLDRAFT_762682 [Exidia glandulosa HHB12029]|uniref:MYND-type domain-containing protein n=1 Tax=Exidia glandulosa HHB12029 TaxID=1314781 RepID=A0A165MK13_EXIGL|nr:hypothetical protein EXIGLDRAFT_762682 [Exidia glandulosa HHB12029]
MSIAARAKAMAASFGSAAQPSWCPECLRTVAFGMSEDNSVILELRTQCHDFWNACMAIAAAPRSPEDLRVLQSTFTRRARACKKKHADRSATRVSLQNMCNVFFDALFECVTAGMSFGERAVGARTKPGQRFNKPGYWPTSIAELFPRGEKESVESYVFWCCQLFSTIPLYALRAFLRIARPIVFPLLMEEPRRAKLMWVLTEMLEPGIVVEWPAGVAPCTKPEGWQLQPWMANPPRRRKCSVCAAVFLSDILSGPDIGLGDRIYFTKGYERPLLTAVLAAFARMQKTGDVVADKPYAMLAGYADVLHALLGLPPLDLPERVRVELPEEDHNQTIPFLIYGYLARSMTLRTCSNPECGLQEKFHGENRAFQLCGSCKMVRYCSKVCQKRHWKMNLPAWGAKGLKNEGPAPHKVACAIICQVLAKVPLRKDSYAFERDMTAAVVAGEISGDDMWTLCSIVMVDPVLAKLSQTTMLRMLLRGARDDDLTKMDWKKACETKFNTDIECTTSEWQERLVANGAVDPNDPTKKPTTKDLLLAGF